VPLADLDHTRLHRAPERRRHIAAACDLPH
jgi:hypothetical protein